MTYDMIDIRDESVEIIISDDGKIVWVNTPECCRFRAQNIPELHIKDSRAKKQEFLNLSPRAHWMFMMMMLCGFAFSFLFSILGFESVHGVLIGVLVGIISGYFIGRKIELEREK